MPDTVLLMKGSAAAGCIAAVVFLLCSWPWRVAAPARRSAGSVLGVGVGFAVGWWLLGVRPNWPPTEDVDRWLLILFPSIVFVELVAAVILDNRRWIRPLRFAVAGLATPLLLYKTIYLVDLAGPGTREWPPPKAAFILTGLALAIFAAWTSLVTLARRADGPTVPLAVAFACLGSGMTIMFSGYASGGQLGLPLATAIGGAAVASWLLSRPVDLSGLLGVAVIGHSALLLSGYFFAELKLVNALLLAVAPQLGWIAEAPFIRRRHVALRAVLRTLPAVVVTVAALALAQQKFVEDSVGPAVDASVPSIDDYTNFGK